MDKAMMALSLDEDDVPFEMPNLSQFRLSERNARSLIGRILNPDYQKMFRVIHEILGSGKRRDLLDVLEKGVHTSNEWALAIERWAITALGERCLGEVKVVAYDPDRPQIQDYVRVLIRFDVSRPLRKNKVINLPEGGTATVRFNYERIQKRCYECQRLNHAKDVCPLLVRQRRESALDRRQRILMEKAEAEAILKPHDPLFGVLSEEQVGVDPQTGRRKISDEVLEEMHRYLLMATEEDRPIRIAMIKSSIAEAEKDPILQKTVLRLEAPPVVTLEVDKGKGRLFDFDLNEAAASSLPMQGGQREGKLLASAFNAFRREVQPGVGKDDRLVFPSEQLSHHQPQLAKTWAGPSSARPEQATRCSSLGVQSDPTEHGFEFSSSSPSGIARKQAKPRRRPHLHKRHAPKQQDSNILQELYGSEGSGSGVGSKRKGVVPAMKARKMKEARVIPHEGSPKHQ
ncbi:uncharacterized protein LOC108825202 [Raphanus sativus]|uniref:Uncharacterized protein LOC108825202 n=1 Tax=Raphanus sativus TaxID=3726 RepID=A0A6J0L1K0_RAPSA|nr:uncharacterized protein LOC108825202 [Raphanus sativus]